MRVIEVKSCRECDYRNTGVYGGTFCRKLWSDSGRMEWIDKRTKTFPKFCPLKEAKT